MLLFMHELQPAGQIRLPHARKTQLKDEICAGSCKWLHLRVIS